MLVTDVQFVKTQLKLKICVFIVYKYYISLKNEKQTVYLGLKN